MSVTVKLPAYLRQYAANKDEVQISGKTVKEVLAGLIKQYPLLKEQLFDKTGAMHNYVSVFAANEVVYPDNLGKPVKDGSTIHILYIIGGG